MRPLSVDEAIAKLKAHEASCGQVDPRVFEEVRKEGGSYVRYTLNLQDSESFLSLIWHSIPEARPLTPPSKPRSLGDCVRRLASIDRPFAQLVEGYPWFKRCSLIDEGFCYARFGLLVLTCADENEKKETPRGSYYMYDGNHKGIVLAKKILRKELDYRPIEALLLKPRRC